MLKKELSTISKVAYMYGVLENELVANLESLEEVAKVCFNIAQDWENFIDIRSKEESRFITAYARRILLERYRIKY